MQCSTCGAIYQIKSVEPNRDEKGVVCCEICGELLLSEESSNYWSAQLVERYKTAEFDIQN